MPRTKPILAKPASAKLPHAILPPQATKPPQASMPPREIEQRDIAFQALALARRADAAGLWITAYLLDMAAMEADPTVAKRLPDAPGARQA